MHALLLIVVALILSATGAYSSDVDLLTYYEKSDYLETPRHAETVEFCRLLDSESPHVKYMSFGETPQRRHLPLLIVDKSESFSRPTDGRTVLMIIACIHPGESDGKDAGLLLIRDFVRDGAFDELFDDIVMLFIPIFNVDGHERFGPHNRINQNGPTEMGFRVTAQGHNLNREFLKADSPEMRAWLTLFNEWLPDFLVDCHVTNGADYQYVVTYGMETHQNMVEPVRTWISDYFVPEMDRSMEEAGFPVVPYVVTRDYEHITNGLIGLLWSPRYSTGYGVVQNRPALLIETHMLKDYKSRVEGTRILLQEIVRIMSEQHAEVRRIVEAADATVAESLQGRFYYTNYGRTKDTTRFLDFKGVDVTVEASELSGDDWIVWGDTPVDYRVPYFDTYKPKDSALVPYAYIIPPEWTSEIALLEAHGVEIQYLDGTQSIEVDSYRFFDLEWDAEPWEGRHRLKFDMVPVTQTREFPDRSAVVIVNQRANQVILHLLEPRCPDSFIRWSFFNTIFDRKEYFERYVMERIARDMLAEDPTLRAEFDSVLAADTSFASSPWRRLNFFYERSPYYDNTLRHYPVGKLMTPAEILLR